MSKLRGCDCRAAFNAEGAEAFAKERKGQHFSASSAKTLASSAFKRGFRYGTKLGHELGRQA